MIAIMIMTMIVIVIIVYIRVYICIYRWGQANTPSTVGVGFKGPPLNKQNTNTHNNT